MAAPILDLDTFADRPTVLIDGTEYELLTHSLLSPLDGHRMSTAYARISELMEKAALTPEEEHELEALPDRMCRMVLEAPEEVHVKLTKKQRMAILSTFSTVLPRARLESTVIQGPALHPTGASSAPDSPGSTEGAP